MATKRLGDRDPTRRCGIHRIYDRDHFSACVGALVTTASEKLKVHGGHIELTAFVGNPPTTIDIAFWPQIVAVVEAAENYREEFALRGIQTAASGQAWRDMQAALAALDKALS